MRTYLTYLRPALLTAGLLAASSASAQPTITFTATFDGLTDVPTMGTLPLVILCVALAAVGFYVLRRQEKSRLMSLTLGVVGALTVTAAVWHSAEVVAGFAPVDVAVSGASDTPIALVIGPEYCFGNDSTISLTGALDLDGNPTLPTTRCTDEGTYTSVGECVDGIVIEPGEGCEIQVD